MNTINTERRRELKKFNAFRATKTGQLSSFSIYWKITGIGEFDSIIKKVHSLNLAVNFFKTYNGMIQWKGQSTNH